MKLNKIILIIGLVLAELFWLNGSGSAVEAVTAASALDKAEVRIPYMELKKLWEAAQAANAPAKPPEPPPSPAGTLLGAHFKADLSAGNVVVEAEFKVESFSGKWERLRLMGAGLSVASVEPPSARLIVDGDDLCLLSKESGPITVRVRFVESSMPAAANEPFLLLTTAPSAVASLEVRGLPEGRVLNLEDGTVPPPLGGVCKIALPAKGGEVALRLKDAALQPKAEPPPPPPQPSEWNLQNEVLVFEGDGELCYRVRVHAMALNGSALEATLLLPPNARTVKATGDDLAESKYIRNADGQMELRLRWNTRDTMEREVKVSYAVQQLPLAQQWDLKAPALRKNDGTKSLFMIAQPPGMEFSGADLKGPVPATKLSHWIADETKSTEFDTVTGGSAVTLQSKLLPRLDTADAIITKCEYASKLVGDGSVLTEATLEIEHDAALRWSITLPEKCELLKCAVNGTPLKPIARDKGVMEIPLDHEPGTKITHSKVVFSYTGAKGKLDAIEGQVLLELPLTPIFIQEVLWKVELPASHEVTSVGEGIEFAEGRSAENRSSNGVRLSKKLCRNERPQVQLFYHKRGLD